MYNRYVPQGDGSYRRRSMPDYTQQQSQRPSPSRAEMPPQQPPCQSGSQDTRPHCTGAQRQCKESTGFGVGSFFRQLLPKGFDTEDLLIVLLLLLMAGDCKEDQNTALLTLALYLFL